MNKQLGPRRLYRPGELSGLRPGGMGISLPQGRWVRQRFDALKVGDLRREIIEQFRRQGASARIPNGGRIAISVGSRGLARLPEMVAAVAEVVRECGAQPFIVPAMGSHGGATAEGQRQILADYGVSEEALGIEVRASMDVVELGRLPSGTPVYFDREAYNSDGIIVLNRVKPHTCFRGNTESGIIKMLTIGLGKHKGATALHNAGFSHFPELLPAAARVTLAKAPVLYGVASIENAFEDVAALEVISADRILEREPELLRVARQKMGRLLIDSCDVLIVDEIGKNISGDGMDPNVTGRYSEPTMSGVEGFQAQKVVVLSLTPETHGNASGLGVADITTQKVLDDIDFVTTYTNAVTSTVLTSARIPVVMPTAREAVVLGLLTANGTTPEEARVVRIKNTLQLERIWASESLWRQIAGRPELEALTTPSSLEIED